MSDPEQLSLAVETPAPMPVLPPLAAEMDADTKPTPVTPEAKGEKPVSISDRIASNLSKLNADRARDEAGRFAPGQKPAPQPNGLVPAGEQPLAPAKIERPADMPKAWGADKAALWTAMTPEQRAYVTDRETQADQLHQNYGGLKKWHETALENGTTLVEAIEKMHAVEAKMYESPPDGIIAAMQAVGLDHGSAVKTLVGALQKLGVNLNGAQVQQGQQPAQQRQPQEFRDPRVDQMLQQQQADKVRQAQEQVAAFRADPNNKHFEEVADDIMREIAFVRSQGQQPDLKTIYERVIWANPGTRQKVLADQAAKTAEAQAQANAQAVAKARSASGSVAGTLPAVEGRAAPKPASLSDAIAARVRTVMTGRV